MKKETTGALFMEFSRVKYYKTVLKKKLAVSIENGCVRDYQL